MGNKQEGYREGIRECSRPLTWYAAPACFWVSVGTVSQVLSSDSTPMLSLGVLSGVPSLSWSLLRGGRIWVIPGGPSLGSPLQDIHFPPGPKVSLKAPTSCVGSPCLSTDPHFLPRLPRFPTDTSLSAQTTRSLHRPPTSCPSRAPNFHHRYLTSCSDLPHRTLFHD